MAADDDAEPARRRWGRLILTLAFTLLLLGVLLQKFAGADVFLSTVARARIELVALALGLAFVCVLLTALRWVQVLAAMGHRLAFGRALTTVLAIWPISVITPSRAGDFARPLMVRDQVPLVAGAGSVLAENAIDIHALLLVALIAALRYRLATESAVFAALIGAEWLAVILVLRGRERLLGFSFLRSRADQIERLYQALGALAARPGKVLVISGTSLLLRFLTVGVIHALLAAVGVSVEFWRLVGPFMVATLASLIPVTLGGMGTRDGAFLLLVNRGYTTPIGEAELLFATVGYSLCAVWIIALIGLPFLARSSLARRAPDRP
jgi:glycosyltransferase 2 family protein